MMTFNDVFTISMAWHDEDGHGWSCSNKCCIPSNAIKYALVSADLCRKSSILADVVVTVLEYEQALDVLGGVDCKAIKECEEAFFEAARNLSDAWQNFDEFENPVNRVYKTVATQAPGNSGPVKG